MAYLIEVSALSKEFHIGPSLIQALKDVDLYVDRGEFLAIMGPSGSGKSTLLHILGCLDRPTSGTYRLDSRDVSMASDKQLSAIRANHIGFVFQTFNLLPQLNLFENVELPFLYSSDHHGSMQERVMHAIEQVGLLDRIDHKPAQLSGGEMQRAAIARALAIEPTLMLADEPTGNVDTETSREILHLFQQLHDDGATIVMVTHDHDVASYAQKTMTLRDGQFLFSREGKP